MSRLRAVLAPQSRLPLGDAPPNTGISRLSLLSPDDPVEGLFSPEEWEAIGRALEFSQRELAVTILLIKGASRQTIAHYLHKADGTSLSAETVRVYIDRVFRKAQVADRIGLAVRLARVYLMLHSADRQRPDTGVDPAAAGCPPAVCHTPV